MDKRIQYDWSDLGELYPEYTVSEIAILKGCRWSTVAMQLRKLGIPKFQEQYEGLRERAAKNYRRHKLGIYTVPNELSVALTFHYRARAAVREVLVSWGCSPVEILQLMRNRNVHHKDGNHENNIPTNL